MISILNYLYVFYYSTTGNWTVFEPSGQWPLLRYIQPSSKWKLTSMT